MVRKNAMIKSGESLGVDVFEWSLINALGNDDRIARGGNGKGGNEGEFYRKESGCKQIPIHFLQQLISLRR